MRSAATAQNPRFQLDRTGDHELIAELTDLVAMARATLADVLCHIAEACARRLYLHYGCSSMFDYATEILGLSEAAALHRIRAARVARRRPEIFEDIAAGRTGYASWRRTWMASAATPCSRPRAANRRSRSARWSRRTGPSRACRIR